MRNAILIAVFTLLPVFISAEIKEIDKFSELENVIESLRSSDWVLFDIDYSHRTNTPCSSNECYKTK